MAAPYIHAKNSVKKFGGKPDDYLDLHKLMDSSKNCFSDSRHRTVTHNIWFCVTVIPLIFGEERTNSDGKKYSTKDVAEMHCIEDLGFIPTIQDYLENMTMQDWMQGGATIVKPIVNRKPIEIAPVEIKHIEQTTHPPFDVIDPAKQTQPYKFIPPPDWQPPVVLD